MWKKILVTVIEIALIAFVVYAVITVCNGISFARQHETVPWCVTVYHN
jgi:hypothetical protein